MLFSRKSSLSLVPGATFWALPVFPPVFPVPFEPPVPPEVPTSQVPSEQIPEQKVFINFAFPFSQYPYVK